jgi:hypothetical protein
MQQKVPRLADDDPCLGFGPRQGMGHFDSVDVGRQKLMDSVLEISPQEIGFVGIGSRTTHLNATAPSKTYFMRPATRHEAREWRGRRCRAGRAGGRLPHGFAARGRERAWPRRDRVAYQRRSWP